MPHSITKANLDKRKGMNEDQIRVVGLIHNCKTSCTLVNGMSLNIG